MQPIEQKQSEHCVAIFSTVSRNEMDFLATVHFLAMFLLNLHKMMNNTAFFIEFSTGSSRTTMVGDKSLAVAFLACSVALSEKFGFATRYDHTISFLARGIIPFHHIIP